MELIAFKDEERVEIKASLKMLVPFEYHSFLDKTNGGIVLTTTRGISIPSINADVAPHIFFGLKTQRKNHDLEYVNNLYRPQMLWDSVIFAIDNLGNYFFFGETGIYYWDISNAFSDNGNRVHFITDSFEQFVNMLGGIDVQEPKSQAVNIIDHARKAIHTTQKRWRKSK